MKHETAAAVLGHYEKAMQEFGTIAKILKKECSAEEWVKYQMAIGQTMGCSLDFAGPIHLEHPDLDVHRISTGRGQPTRGPPDAASSEPSVVLTSDEKVELLQTLAVDVAVQARRRPRPNAEVYTLCFEALVTAGALAERLPRDPGGVAASSGLILDALMRAAHCTVMLSERSLDEPSGEQDPH